MNIDRCPSCLSTERYGAFEVVDHMVSGETFSVEFCSTCNLGITNPRPDSIATYYDSPAYVSHLDQGQGMMGRLYGMARSFASWTKVRLIASATKKSKGSLLDYGCGVGFFASRAERRGWLVQGVELSDSARAKAQEKLKVGTVVSSREELPDTKYDAVTLFHVLEHLDDPVETLQWIRDRLNPGGAIIVALPNHASPDAGHYGRFWAAWDVPIHYWHFTKESMTELAKRKGLFVESVHPMRMDAFYVSLLSERYKNGSSNWISAFYQGLRSNILGGESNASSLIYVLRKVA
jgi:2-polyprenyl-3-methyl-5-hydroxy-6-metoxy-1,4-benzoquinol methylase